MGAAHSADCMASTIPCFIQLCFYFVFEGKWDWSGFVKMGLCLGVKSVRAYIPLISPSSFSNTSKVSKCRYLLQLVYLCQSRLIFWSQFRPNQLAPVPQTTRRGSSSCCMVLVAHFQLLTTVRSQFDWGWLEGWSIVGPCGMIRVFSDNTDGCPCV